MGKCDYCTSEMVMCDCGQMFPKSEDVEICFKCSNPDEHFISGDCGLCGIKDVILMDSDSCSHCHHLELRVQKDLGLFMLKVCHLEIKGKCVHCGNLLHGISGGDCMCYGCCIEPFNKCFVKPCKK